MTRTILFFSYKGGTGRSLCLCNTAAALLRRGKRVGLVDFDVEAPSLHIYLENFLASKIPTKKDSVTDILSLLELSSGDLSPDRLKEAVRKINVVGANNSDGELFLIPCLSRLNDLHELDGQWAECYREFSAILKMFSTCHSLDYILIDSRTGYSQQAFLAAFACDEVVAVTRADYVSRNGMKTMLKHFSHRPMPVHLVINSVPSRVNFTDDRIKKYLKAVGYKKKVTFIPYAAEWYFAPKIIWKANRKNFLLDAFNNIARVLS